MSIVSSFQTDFLAEREILASIDHPFIIGLHYAFQNASKLYFVMDFMQGGDLLSHLDREGKFTELRAKFYAAEILIALQHLHEN